MEEEKTNEVEMAEKKTQERKTQKKDEEGKSSLTNMNSNKHTSDANSPLHFELESIIGEMRLHKGFREFESGIGEYKDNFGTRAVITSNGSRYDKLDVYYLPGKQPLAWDFVRKIEAALKEPLIYPKYHPLMVLPNNNQTRSASA